MYYVNISFFGNLYSLHKALYIWTVLLLWHTVQLVTYCQTDRVGTVMSSISANCAPRVLMQQHTLCATSAEYLHLMWQCSCSPLPSPKNGHMEKPTPHLMLEHPALEGKCSSMYTSSHMHYNYTCVNSQTHHRMVWTGSDLKDLVPIP